MIRLCLDWLHRLRTTVEHSSEWSSGSNVSIEYENRTKSRSTDEWSGQTSALLSQSMSTMRRLLSSTRSTTRPIKSLTGSRGMLVTSGRKSSVVCNWCRLSRQAWRRAPIRNRFRRRRVLSSRGPSSPALHSGGSMKCRSATSNLRPIPSSYTSQYRFSHTNMENTTPLTLLGPTISSGSITRLLLKIIPHRRTLVQIAWLNPASKPFRDPTPPDPYSW